MCGITSKLNLGILEEYIKNFDIACLSETKTDYINDAAIDGYTPIIMSKKQVNHKYGGIHGLCIFVKNDIYEYVSVLPDTTSESILWLKFTEGAFGTACIIGSVYTAHEGSDYYVDDVYDNLANDILNFNCTLGLPILMVGDFNARTGVLDDFVSIEDNVAFECGIDLSDNDIFSSRVDLELLGIETVRYNSDKGINNNGRNLIEMCKCMDLKIVNGRFGSDKGIGDFTCHTTRGGKSVVDYVIASPSLMANVSEFQVENLDKCLSDVHSAIWVALAFVGASDTDSVNSYIHEPNDVANTEYELLRSKWEPDLISEYKNAFDLSDITKLSSKLDSVDANSVTQADIDGMVKDFTQICINPAKAINICKPAKSGTYRQNKRRTNISTSKPWFDKECEAKRKEYFRIKNRLKKTKTHEAQMQLKAMSKVYKSHLKKTMKRYNKDLQKKLRNLKTSNPKEYWNILNKAGDYKESMGKISLDAFMLHFKQLSQKPDHDEESNEFDPRTIDHSINEEINREFTLNEIERSIKSLKNNKACGIDNVINEYLKNCPAQLLTVIVKLFNVVLLSGVVPDDWCVGVIQPLYKQRGSINDPDNYRGITLLSCVGKLFTSCLNQRMSGYIEATGTLGSEQAGFRAGYSTLDHMFVLHSLIELYLAHKKRIYCAFVDYKKAFDLVDRSSLWLKLISSGLNGNVVKVVYNIYDKAKSCVKKGGAISNFFMCNVGVRQGENLSPLLFALYLNDFERHVSRRYNGLDFLCNEISDVLSDDDVEVFLRLYVLLYADDTIILAENAKELEQALAAVADYCREWHLTVNTSKTKVVIFSRGKVRKHPQFKFGDDVLDVVDEYVYLGTTFNYNGLFKKAIKKQVNQARRAMYALLAKAKKLALPVDIQCELFNQIVTPILLYGCEIWGFENLDQVQVFHRKFLKNVLKLNKRTANCMVYGEVGCFDLNMTVQKRMINFWIRLTQGNQSKLSVTMYKLLKQLHDRNNVNETYKPKWICKVKSILDSCGFSNMWHDHNINSKWLLKSIELRLKDIELQNWKSEVDRNRLCRVYRLFKTEVCIEQYLLKLDIADRINLCKFRCGNHKLPISECRYQENVSDMKRCTHCDRNDQGDEFHYILVCPFLQNTRKKFVKQYYYTRPNTLKMNQLFNVQNVKQLKHLAKFVNIIMSMF